MTKTIQFTLLFFSFCTLLSAQTAENSKWYFGLGAAADFNDGTVPPISIDGQNQNAGTGAASVSDENGNLLFYTNGYNVWNASHNEIQGTPFLQGVIKSHIVPIPGSSSEYFVFTNDSQNENGANTRWEYYSIVDMSLNGGQGGIAAGDKNIQLLQNVSTKAATFINPVDNLPYIAIWGQQPGASHINPVYNTMYIYQIAGRTAINLVHQQTFTNFQYFNGGLSGFDYWSDMKVSPDATKIAFSHNQGAIGADDAYMLDLVLGDGTASVTNLQPLGDVNPISFKAFGIEFSPDSNLLYIAASNQLYQGSRSENEKVRSMVFQLNLDAKGDERMFDTSIIYDSGTSPNAQILGLQLAIDGKIYSSKLSTTLGVIQNPNTLGVGANYNHDGFPLGFGVARNGHLPPLVPISPIPSPCTTLGVWPLAFDSNNLSIYTRSVLETDNLGNVYTANAHINNSGLSSGVLKYDSSGMFVWESATTSNMNVYDLKSDLNGNIYVVGVQNAQTKIKKIDVNGNLVWELYSTENFVTSNIIAIDKGQSKLYAPTTAPNTSYNIVHSGTMASYTIDSGSGTRLLSIDSNGSINEIDYILNSHFAQPSYDQDGLHLFGINDVQITFSASGDVLTTPTSDSYHSYANYTQDVLNHYSNITIDDTSVPDYFNYNPVDNTIYRTYNGVQNVEEYDIAGTLTNQYLLPFSVIDQYYPNKIVNPDTGKLYLYVDRVLQNSMEHLFILGQGQIDLKTIATDFCFYNRSIQAIALSGSCIFVKGRYNCSSDVTISDGIVLPAVNANESRSYILRLQSDLTIQRSSEDQVAIAPKAIDPIHSFSAYPNPTNSLLTIQNNELENGVAEVTVSNIYGNQLDRFSMLETEVRVTYDMSDLSQGIYFISILKSDGLIEILKVIKK